MMQIQISLSLNLAACHNQTMTTERDKLLRTIAGQVLDFPATNVVRVAIDGDAGAGKTTFGDELTPILEAAGRPVIRASVDGFHNPRGARYRLGADSPQGFFLDSYNYEELAECLLRPLSAGGTRCFQRAAFDHRTDRPVVAAEEYAEPNSILVFDGLFLHRPELRFYWDFSIFLDVDFRISIPRCAQRGEGSPDPLAASNRRYVEGQNIYLAQCSPKAFASVIVNNEDLENPYIVAPAGS